MDREESYHISVKCRAGKQVSGLEYVLMNQLGPAMGSPCFKRRRNMPFGFALRRSKRGIFLSEIRSITTAKTRFEHSAVSSNIYVVYIFVTIDVSINEVD
uniref:Uncharacterized protein n=1 Tax=Spongospora subterranea TaxID=70186 RepID=A0A0H5R6L1_9EUKA|eukprot:CRZ09461.1 hypothetical protein [Spongospora subterranea]